MMIKIFKSEKWFMIPYLVFLSFAIYLIIEFSKSQIHLAINAVNFPATDFLFKYITLFGDGAMPFIIGVAFLFFSFRQGFEVMTSGTIAGLFAQLLKRNFFNEYYRPVKFFEGTQSLHLVEGVNQHTNFSFPSGHAATSFALGFFLCLLVIRPGFKLMFFLLAVIVAFSRVYLSQHFLVDIVAGSVIGVLSAVMVHSFFQQSKALWLNKSFLEILKKKEVHE